MEKSSSSLCGALVTLVLNLSPTPYVVMEIMFWMLGSLADLSMTHVMLALPFVFVGWIMLFSTARMLNMLTLGQGAAVSMGMDARRLNFFLGLGTAASVGISTVVAGAIGFAGLVVPYILRPLVSAMPSRLLPAGAAGGAIMVLASDVAVRWIVHLNVILSWVSSRQLLVHRSFCGWYCAVEWMAGNAIGCKTSQH